MNNIQLYCDRCGKLMYDKQQNIDEHRNSFIATLGASESGTWGKRYNEVAIKSDDGICDDCFSSFLAIAEILRDWSVCEN